MITFTSTLVCDACGGVAREIMIAVVVDPGTAFRSPHTELVIKNFPPDWTKKNAIGGFGFSAEKHYCHKDECKKKA